MPTVTAQTVRRELQRLSRARAEEFQRTLTHFAIERLLYRLSRSPEADRFLLKGAMLFVLWIGHLHRSTRDLDLAARGDPNPDNLGDLFRRLCMADSEPDGLRFDADSVQICIDQDDDEI